MNKLLLTVGLAPLILLTISGCPQLRKHHVQFEQAGKRHKELKLQAVNGKVKMEILSNGGYKGGMYELYLQIDISTDYLIEDLSINPESIFVYIGETQLTKKKIMGGDTFYLKKNKHFYRNGFYFNCSMDRVKAEIAMSKNNKLKFIFDQFIRYNDMPVLFDTVFAVDTGELTDLLNELVPQK